MQMFQENYQNAKGIANTPFTPFTGESVAGLNPTQMYAKQMYGDIANNQTGAGPTAHGVAGAGGILDSSYDLSQYMNPYTSDVINRTISDQERARQMAMVSTNQAATAANAFGGSRSGVLGAQTNEAYDRNTGDLIANLNQANFTQAQGARTADQSAKLQASGLLGDLGNQQLQQAQSRAAGVNNFGIQEQTTQQAKDDAAYQEFLRQIGYPLEQQNIRNASLGLIPVQSNTNSTTTQRNSGGGLGGILGAVGSIASIFGH
jgi:hypothetical protein